ncbi:MAG TPA: energy transducer TonB [Rhodanobacteraceae bacterium]|nr:energy transducer TonB [Rhodanobacteraceae bacterium]
MTRTLLLIATALAALGLVAIPAWAQSHVRKVSPDKLSHYWVRTNSYVDAQAPNSGRGLDKIGCAAVSYTIGADGETRHVKVEKVVPSTSDFQVTASSLVEGLHYAPAEQNKAEVPVHTYFIVPFNVPEGDSATMQKVLESCHLPGYGD